MVTRQALSPSASVRTCSARMDFITIFGGAGAGAVSAAHEAPDRSSTARIPSGKRHRRHERLSRCIRVSFTLLRQFTRGRRGPGAPRAGLRRDVNPPIRPDRGIGGIQAFHADPPSCDFLDLDFSNAAGQCRAHGKQGWKFRLGATGLCKDSLRAYEPGRRRATNQPRCKTKGYAQDHLLHVRHPMGWRAGPAFAASCRFKGADPGQVWFPWYWTTTVVQCFTVWTINPSTSQTAAQEPAFHRETAVTPWKSHRPWV